MMVKSIYTFTTPSSSGATDVSDTPYQNFGMQVSASGGVPITWTVFLEGSIDGINFTPIMSHTNLTGLNIILWASNQTPVTHFRTRCSVLSLGLATELNVHVLGGR